mgnify:CR=1 FL=1
MRNLAVAQSQLAVPLGEAVSRLLIGVRQVARVPPVLVLEGRAGQRCVRAGQLAGDLVRGPLPAVVSRGHPRLRRLLRLVHLPQ